MPNRLRAPLLPGIISLALLGAVIAGPGTRAAAQPATQDDPPASLTVLTVNGDDEPVPGACYDLFVDEDGPAGFVAERCDAYDGAADGVTGFAGIPSGDYVLVQLFVPAGYKTGKDRSVTIVAGEDTVYSFRTPRGGRSVTLALQDDNDQPLPGGCYSLYPVDTGGPPGPASKVACDFYDGADDGTATVSGLDNGAYDVILSAPPEGYTIPIGQSIDTGGDDRSLVFAVALGGETVTITTVDDSGDPVPGSCHRLYAATSDGGPGALVAAPCDRSDGAGDGTITVLGLPPGAYLLAAPGAPATPAGDGSAGVSSATPTAAPGIPFDVVAGEDVQIEVVSLPTQGGTPTA